MLNLNYNQNYVFAFEINKSAIEEESMDYYVK
jgi:hypothetical protein